MEQVAADRKIFSLLDICSGMERMVRQKWSAFYWVRAEMNRLQHYPSSGHCYPELVQKHNGRIIAQMKAVIWSSDFRCIQEKFINTVREPLRDGINILFYGQLSFHPVHGLSMRIVDIDPGFSIGELELEKQQAISILKKEGLFGKNKELPFPVLPKRVAVISVESSKGYHDFLKIISERGTGFFHMLFPSVLQGEKAIAGIILQLRNIVKVQTHFDAVAIIRGGGGEIGLSCYNDKQLCREIAQFPLPVLTGIGHATNETVAEMVSYKNCITPTDLANYLLQPFGEFRYALQEIEQRLEEYSTALLKAQQEQLHTQARFLRPVARHAILEKRNRVEALAAFTANECRHIISTRKDLLVQQQHLLSGVLSQAFLNQKEYQARLIRDLKKDVINSIRTHREQIKIRERVLTGSAGFFLWQQRPPLQACAQQLNTVSRGLLKEASGSVRFEEEKLRAYDPVNVLKRGYSITLINGRALNKISQAVEGNEITTLIHDGSITSIITNSKIKNE